MPSSRVVALATCLLLATGAVGCAAEGPRVVAAGALAGGQELVRPEPSAASPRATTTSTPAPTTTVTVASAPAPTAPPETAPPTTLAPEPAPAPAPEPAPAPAPEPAPAPAPERPAPPVAGATAPAGTWFDSSAEWDFLARTNAERDRIGVGALSRDGGLDAYAREHAIQMMAAGHIYHSEISVLLGGWWTVGENVGVGPSVGPIQQALLDSPPHYANISHGDFTAMGVGVLADSNGRIWTVHVYGA